MSAAAPIRVSETRCLNCGYTLDAIGGLDHDEQPSRGDPVACIRCGAVMVWDSGALRPFTEAEARALTGNVEMMLQLGQLVGTIRIVQAAKN